MHLLIISHTEHYKDSDGTIKGWGPTIREINYLSSKFDTITHLACLHEGKIPQSSLPYTSNNIKFVELPPSGGKTIVSKLNSLSKIPEIIKKVADALKTADIVQLRVPTGMANYLLPYLTLQNKKPPVWVKYAGNWNQENAPLGYQFQRWWLKKNFLHCKVTINGKWDDQPSHCYTFENPCLDEAERKHGKNIIAQKNYSGPYKACFIGRIETQKGVGRIIEALSQFANQNINTIHFIGAGRELENFKILADKQHQVKCIFHNSVARDQIVKFLEESHFLLLPSTASEGFPKVIAEGANYGAIPIVSDISSIGQYINNENGFVWNHKTSFTDFIGNLKFDERILKNKSKISYASAEEFTFERYYSNLKKFILP